MLETVTPAVSVRLTTAETAREELGDLAVTWSDARLNRQIDRVSALIRSAISLYAVQTIRERLTAGDRGEAILSAAPVRQVVSIVDSLGNTRDVTGYEVDVLTGIIRPIDGSFFSEDGASGVATYFGDGGLATVGDYEGLTVYPYASFRPSHRLAVVYTGGWIMPGQNGRDLPEDIEAVALDLIRDRVSDLARNPSIRTESTPDAGMIQYFDAKRDNFAVPPALADLISRYAPVRM